jgi:hypothetical protein
LGFESYRLWLPFFSRRFRYPVRARMDPKSKEPQQFYRWVDAEGRLHVVSSLEAVPSAERARAERVTLTGQTALPSVPSRAEPQAEPSAWRFDLGSFGIGFGAALAISLLFRLLPNGWRSLTRVAVVLGLGALLTGLYLGAIRRAAGGGAGGALASPSALIQDAKTAVEQMNQRQKQQEEELRQIQAEGR